MANCATHLWWFCVLHVYNMCITHVSATHVNHLYSYTCNTYEKLVKLLNDVTFQMLHHIVTFENVTSCHIVTYICNITYVRKNLGKMTHRW